MYVRDIRPFKSRAVFVRCEQSRSCTRPRSHGEECNAMGAAIQTNPEGEGIHWFLVENQL